MPVETSSRPTLHTDELMRAYDRYHQGSMLKVITNNTVLWFVDVWRKLQRPKNSDQGLS